MSAITIIIPTGCDPEGLRLTLRSLSGQVTDRDSILVVNDGAHAAVSTVCREHGAGEESLAVNRGSYHARNAGIQNSTTEWLGFVDAGVEAAPGWVSRAKAALADHGYVAGPIRQPQADLHNAVEVYQSLYAFPVAHYFRHEGYGPTANLCVRREVFQAVGPFDDRLTSGGDKEFGHRVARWKKDCQVFDAARWVQHEFRSLPSLKKKIRRAAIGARQLAQLFPGQFAVPTLFSRRGLSYLLPPPYLKLLRGKPLDAAAGGTFPLGSVAFPVRLRVYLIAYQLRLLSLFPGVDARQRADSIEWANGKPTT